MMDPKTKSADVYPYFYTKSKIDILNKYLPRNGKVLDIGCGAGHDLFHASQIGFEGVGVDLNPRIISFAKEMANKLQSGVTKKDFIYQMRINKSRMGDVKTYADPKYISYLPERDDEIIKTKAPVSFFNLDIEKNISELTNKAPFNAVMLSSVSQYLSDHKKLLLNLRKMLSPGGLVIFSDLFSKTPGFFSMDEKGNIVKKETMFSYPKVVPIDSLFNALGFEKVDSYTEATGISQRQFHIFKLKDSKINENEIDEKINQIAIPKKELIESISLSKDKLKQMMEELEKIKNKNVKRLIKENLLGIYFKDISDFIVSENDDIIEFIHKRLIEETGELPTWDDELALLEKLKEINLLVIKCSKSENPNQLLSNYVERKIKKLKEINNEFSNRKLKTFEKIKRNLE